MNISTSFELDSPSTNSTEIFTILTTYPMLVKFTLVIVFTRKHGKRRYIYMGFWVLGVMIGEDLQKFSESRVMRTIAIGRDPIRNLPKNTELKLIEKKTNLE
ncbi:hypothetical protein AVEN_153116-1 [Araneus ventricosus]|uniref:Uncharacterized protein n=1 Tax=Araneus ventricosus TaxID=182803 RepID=A0A4Y2IHV5_ARAVE|nr:hypothetical protein AVEN_153116-1 [Araneus ventricosus]